MKTKRYEKKGEEKDTRRWFKVGGNIQSIKTGGIYSLLFLLSLVIIGFSMLSCGNQYKIIGQVIAPDSTGVEGVTIKVDNSTFSAVTDNKGKYSIDYAPGSFKLIFSKNGHTTHTIDLNITAKTIFPAETVMIYPIPEKKGIYYLDGNQLIEIKASAVREREWTRYPKNYSQYYIVGDRKNTQSIRPGILHFIDTNTNRLILARLNDNLIQSFSYSWGDWEYGYDGFFKDKSEDNIGKENIKLRTVEVKPGYYAWVEVVETFSGKIRPDKNKRSFPFCVFFAPLLEKDKTAILDLIISLNEIIKGNVAINKDFINKLVHYKDGKGATENDLHYYEELDWHCDSINVVRINPSPEVNHARILWEIWEKGEKDTTGIESIKINENWYIWVDADHNQIE